MPSLAWLLVLTFPNGGSTALARLLLSAQGTVALHRKAEGQWLLPELSPELERWDPRLPFDAARLRAVWTQAALDAREDRCPDAAETLVIEKSPPSMCRHGAIRAALSGMPTHLAVLTRDPYATCASWHVRHGVAQGASGLKAELARLESLALTWLERGRMLRAALPEAITHIRYEHLTADPRAALAPLVAALPVLRGIDYAAEFRVKSYPRQSLRNYNTIARARLDAQRQDAISRGLAQDPETVSALGYRIE